MSDAPTHHPRALLACALLWAVAACTNDTDDASPDTHDAAHDTDDASPDAHDAAHDPTDDATHDAADVSPDDDASPDADDASPDADPWADLPPVPEGMVRVRVSLDGQPSPNTRVTQGGAARTWYTDARGTVTAQLFYDVEGELALIASHPEARMRAAVFEGDERELTIELARLRPDNARAPFSDPGEPTRRPNTNQCSHCHQTIGDAWFDSPHRTSASNPRVHDLYAGTAANLPDEPACAQAGGRWLEGLAPGTGERAMRCYLGAGALPALNPDCADEGCDGRADDTAACADCHAPEMPGRLGGRDLLDAKDSAYRYGVACAACHQAERVDLDAPPGTAGRLRLVRPSEAASPALGAGGFLPLTFGPDHDSPNPRMGGVQRDHFRDGKLCAGCHQHEGAPRLAGVTLDPARWPSGRLPFQSTYEEWRTGALGTSTRCPSCHMPPDPLVANSADLQRFHDAQVGVQGGWYRPPGAVRQHSFLGPRQPQSNMLQLAAALFIRRKETLEGGRLRVEVETRNVGAGHAIPTGEAMRALYLRVEAWCGDQPLPPIGGDAIPAIGGALARRGRAQGWTRWPEARPGDLLRVVARPGTFYDYTGVEPFTPARMTPAQRGLPVERVVAQVEIAALSDDGEATLSAPLPEGDEVYLIRDEPGRAPFLAGAPGFAFARVLVDAQGQAQAPHFVAVDVASDNRLMPQAAWTSSHDFDASACPDPQARAQLYYRPYPRWLADEKRWEVQDTLMNEVRR